MKRIALVTAIGLLLAGCGNGTRSSGKSTQQSVPAVATTTTPSTTSTQPAKKQVVRATSRAAVRSALAANHSLAIKVLWTNSVPATAQKSTRGPALTEMAASAKNRQKKGIRVRMIHDNYRIVSIDFGAAEMTAHALAVWNQRVVPSHSDGTPLGRPVTLHERARIELRRADSSQNFVVWKVTLVK